VSWLGVHADTYERPVEIEHDTADRRQADILGYRTLHQYAIPWLNDIHRHSTRTFGGEVRRRWSCAAKSWALAPGWMT